LDEGLKTATIYSIDGWLAAGFFSIHLAGKTAGNTQDAQSVFRLDRRAEPATRNSTTILTCRRDLQGRKKGVN
jgi:hypothetical protein